MALTVAMAAVAAVQGAESPPLAPGYQSLPYKAPPPGTYTLPVLGQAADGQVLDASGHATTLHTAFGRKIVLLSFIYATCDDANGCPLATLVLHRVQSALQSRPQLKDRLRLITLSFNPVHDTPEVMSAYAKSFQSQGNDWQFLTTRSTDQLQPILRDYHQSIEQEIDSRGHLTGQYAHLLRVYLMDDRQRIRNIYSVSVLHPDLIMADIETLALEPAGGAGVAPDSRQPSDRLSPGDDKKGYAGSDYQTRSMALTERTGKPADLLRLSRQPVTGLPGLPVPADNPLSQAKISLGRKLFYDRRLSLNGTFSCAMCHIPEQGFTHQEQATAIGIEGHTVRRNSPTLYNVAYMERLFHDARESTLENQVWGPFLAANEMGNPSVGFVIDKLKALPDYQHLFEKAFRRGPGMETVGQALASYERTLVSGNSPFDRWHYGHQPAALSPEAQNGYGLFVGRGGCSQCHAIGPRDALFTDHQLHNTGIGYQQSMNPVSARTHLQVAPGVSFEVDAATISQVAEPVPGDLGRYEVTLNPADRWKYRTPTLRNIALTAPYMHDGSKAGLRDVVEFYSQGGIPNETLDPLIHPLNLTETEINELVAFLQSLTGSNVAELVSDAWSAPVGER